MSPKAKKRLRKRTERCTGCRRKFTPTGYWQHLRQTTKPACIAIHEAEARYRPLPSDESANPSSSSSSSHSASQSRSSPAQLTSEHDEAPDTEAQPFDGDYYGDYQPDDFDDFDEFDAVMEVDPRESDANVEGEFGGGFGENAADVGLEGGGLGEAELPGGGRGGVVVGAALGLSLDDHFAEAGDGPEEQDGIQEAGNEDDEVDRVEEEDAAEEDADLFEEEGAWEPLPPNHPPFNGDLAQDQPPDPDHDEDIPLPRRQHVQEQLFRKTFIVHFPGSRAGAPTLCASTSSSYSEYQNNVDTNGRNPYAPFRSAVDWKVARWAKMRGPGSTAVTELLGIEEVSTTVYELRCLIPGLIP